MKLKLSSWLLFASLVCFAWVIALVWQRYTPISMAFTASPTTVASPQGDLVADGISLPDLDLSLPVIPGVIRNGLWPVTSRGVIYLASTPQPGTKGNSILYGHNWPNLLGKLKTAQPGEKILVHYTNGRAQAFVIAAISEVSPTDVGILKPTPDTRLTLYTCTGFLDTKRLVVTARPI